MNEIEPAIEQFKRATNADQKLYEAWKNLGVALKKAERYPAAQMALACAHHLDRTQPEPVLNIVHMLIDNRHYKKAEELMDKLLDASSQVSPELAASAAAYRCPPRGFRLHHREPRSDRSGGPQHLTSRPELDNIWSFYLQIHGRYDEAIAVLEDWVDKESVHQEHCVTQLGLCYAEAGRIDAGIAYHKDLLAKNPDHVVGRYNLSMLQMKSGDVAEGFANYEARWKRREFPSKRRVFDAPRWEGQPLEGKKLLVWREQGIGDEVRFASLLPDLETCGASVSFECTPKLAPLWERSFPWATIGHEGETDCRGEAEYRDFDFQIPAGSLAAFLRPTVDAFSEKQSAWIRRYGDAEQKVREQLAIGPDETLVGVCWRSSFRATSRVRYFLGCDQLEPLKALTNTRWLNVQYDCSDEEIETVRSLGLPLHHFTDVDQRDDLVSACGLIGACDVVISVGVSVADLAAGLGVPVVQFGPRTIRNLFGHRSCAVVPDLPVGTDETLWR